MKSARDSAGCDLARCIHRMAWHPARQGNGDCLRLRAASAGRAKQSQCPKHADLQLLSCSEHGDETTTSTTDSGFSIIAEQEGQQQAAVAAAAVIVRFNSIVVVIRSLVRQSSYSCPLPLDLFIFLNSRMSTMMIIVICPSAES